MSRKFSELTCQEFCTPPVKGVKNSVPLPLEVSGILYPSGPLNNERPLIEGTINNCSNKIYIDLCLSILWLYISTDSWLYSSKLSLSQYKNDLESTYSVYSIDTNLFGMKLDNSLGKIGSVHNLRPGGPEGFRGAPFLPRIRGDRDFFLPMERPGKILTASKGGPEFFCITHDKKFPQKGSKTPFLHVLGGFSPLCVSGQTMVSRGIAFNFQIPGGGTRFF